MEEFIEPSCVESIDIVRLFLLVRLLREYELLHVAHQVREDLEGWVLQVLH
jgi:hypothetical protein